jgi:hypothetical protein
MDHAVLIPEKDQQILCLKNEIGARIEVETAILQTVTGRALDLVAMPRADHAEGYQPKVVEIDTVHTPSVHH